MATREEETARWRAISRNSRKAAQHLLDLECYRSSISPAYYAAYAAITSALISQGITPSDMAAISALNALRQLTSS